VPGSANVDSVGYHSCGYPEGLIVNQDPATRISIRTLIVMMILALAACGGGGRGGGVGGGGNGDPDPEPEPPDERDVEEHKTLTWDGSPGICLTCHVDEAQEVHSSLHYQWQAPAPDMASGPADQGKIAGAVNSYCINVLGN